MRLPSFDRYGDLYRDFSWRIPEDFNIGRAVSDEWAVREPERVCLEHFSPDGDHLSLTYGELSAASSMFANALASLGIKRGDRVALLMPQSFETVIAHVAIYKMGVIALPLALLFGIEALEYRLRISGAAAIITNDFGLDRVRQIRDRLPELRHVISVSEAADALSFADLTASHAPVFEGEKTTPDDPALMIFTSGTTGPPKGALHGHRVLPGHIPGMQFAHEGFPKAGDKVWTPSDWAWAGGLLNALLPSLLLGIPVVSSPAQKFDADTAYRIMAKMKVRNAFIPPTALRLMRSVSDPRSKYDLVLRTIGSAGEALGRETYDWARRTLGVTVNEFYGQTECNFVLSSSAAFGVTKAGAIGRAVPGHRVAIVSEAGDELPAGESGQIAIASPDPVMFLGYWNDAAATERKFLHGWLLTGDIGRQDEDGYVTFEGRDDDVITSSGYRIGPAEIEDCLIGHPAVQLAAAVGKPDAVRTEIVKAYIVLSPGHLPSEALAAEIREWVKMRLSMHEYPREVEFVESLPLTTTGKVIRRLLREKAAAEG
ncbi:MULTISPECIES: AMP-binding protein [Rhizobium]|uniref:AMP-binding protein n=1 Tax=Rhizobium TaxID=379 RepID=UPI0007EB14E1|nr:MULTISPECIES: AMP-binding protein [Rhizobium]ANK93361.1 AMP-dependent synthetase/ligase protein [Rhizobium sp. N6212]ANK99407.1 AMP-dependent synthetase/ligase protein [Rhizobium sp. N621]ANL05538.1 AMP-dependent synthetase/ligase protein [Rhizobium esperanzae]ANL11591.1 AMP-dependent synthetase/ligase protein [Rhizobium sp. N1341]ANL23664.1 AMP-dependent synthetase/ligase protein [Rhizobium sp. N113]